MGYSRNGGLTGYILSWFRCDGSELYLSYCMPELIVASLSSSRFDILTCKILVFFGWQGDSEKGASIRLRNVVVWDVLELICRNGEQLQL